MRNRILIADSGATTTDWCLLEQTTVIKRFSTKGISPIFQSEEEIAKEIHDNVLPQMIETMPHALFFYGTGCIPEKIEGVKRAIQLSFPIDKVEVYSDLIAAAHALCGNHAGIACILGTGSNSCEWNGQEIVNQVSPLGFILGDEGSGGSLGKLLVSDVLKNQLPQALKQKFLQQYNLTPALIIENVYRKPFPSRFLASLTPFLLENIEDKSVKQIVQKSFTDFFIRNVMQYNYTTHVVHFVGSIAYYYASTLKEVAIDNHIETGKIEQSPMAGLIDYYSQQV